MINKNSAIPLYDQLVNLLVKEIEENLRPNDKMLSEREICQVYDVSRTTVRLALTELENMGYIYKQPGKGSFVASLNRDKQNLMDYYSFTEQMKQQGKEPQTKIIDFQKVYVNEYICGKLNVGPTDLVYKLKRLRLADGFPMMVEYTYIPVSDFPELTLDKLNEKPLYNVFNEDYHKIIKLAEEEFSASLVTEKEAAMLDVPIQSACLKLKRVAYDRTNKVVEFTISTARSDQFNYKVKHFR